MANNRWNTPEEIKRTLVPGGQPGKGGVVLYQEKGVNWVDPGESHTMILGSTGSGKTRRCIIPLLHMLLASEESLIVVDPKNGELYRATAALAMEKGYDIHVINLQSLIHSERYNPLQLIRVQMTSHDPVQKEAGYRGLGNLGYALFPSDTTKEQHWSASAKTLFEGTVMALIQLGTPEQVHLSNVYRMVAASGNKECIQTVYRTLLGVLPKESLAYMLLQSYTHAPTETAASTQVVCLESLMPFIGCDSLQSMLSGEEFQITNLDGEKPTVIYIELADETPVYDPIASVLISQLMDWYIMLAQDRYHGALPRRMNIILEELGSIGRAISGLDHLLSASRSRNIRCHMVLQTLTSQLETLYGRSKTDTIQSNAALKIIFRTDHVDTLTQLSHLCGQRTTLAPHFVETDPLITVSQIAAMKTGQALVHSDCMKFVTKLRDYSEYISCQSVELPKREAPLAVPPIFDLEEYLKENSRKCVKKALDRLEGKPVVVFEERFEDPLLNWDLMKKDIDRETANLEEEKKMEKVQEYPVEEVHSKEGSSLILLSVGKPEYMEDVQRVVEQYAFVEPDAARAIVENLPSHIDFDNQRQAEDAMKALADAGGVAVFDKITDEQTED